ncbi:MAG: hypothetical protein AAFZ65_20040 [Planctomycetota bacterium]
MGLSWTQEELDTLGEAIKSGALKVKYDGPNGSREVEYASIAQMRALYADGERALGLATKHDNGFRYLTHDRGTNR